MKELTEKLLRKFNQIILATLPNSLLENLVQPYLAGQSLEEGINTALEYKKKGRLTTLDLLGESASNLPEANKMFSAYHNLVELITAKNRFYSSLSVKPSSICAVNPERTNPLPETPLLPRLEQLVKFAQERETKVTLDMEDHYWTNLSLQTASSLWQKKYDLGIVLQSRLYRTKKDIQELFVNFPHPGQARVRACLGIYLEPPPLAVKTKKEAKQLLVKIIEELLDLQVYVEIATHDRKIISQIQKEVLEPKLQTGRISVNDFEFQFLKGVQNAYQVEQELMERKYKVRYYLPIELNKGDGLPYLKRRLIANPNLSLLGIKNLIQKLSSSK